MAQPPAATSGSPLPEGPRQRFEASLGTDLGAVRPHDGAASHARRAMSVRADATVIGTSTLPAPAMSIVATPVCVLRRATWVHSTS